MSQTNESAAVHIPREHQSAPKATDADKAIAIAAEEIATGKFVPPERTDGEEFFNYGPTQKLATHPAVLEALAKLEREAADAGNTQEYLEKTHAQFEVNEMLSQPDKWDGQGRWMGKENEEMRMGLLLTPFQFMERLEKVIGPGRVELNRFAVLKRVALLVPDPEKQATVIAESSMSVNLQLVRDMERGVSSIDMRRRIAQMEAAVAQEQAKRKNILPEYMKGKVQVGTLQYPLGTEWMVMHFDEYGVPTTAKYLGWRTALLSMVLLGVVTEKEAHKAFPLGSGPAAAWYREQLFIHRSRGRLPS